MIARSFFSRRRQLGLLFLALLGCGESTLVTTQGELLATDDGRLAVAGSSKIVDWPYAPSAHGFKKLFENAADCAADLADPAQAANITTMAHMYCCADPAKLDFSKGAGPLTDKIKCLPDPAAPARGHAEITCDGNACKATECLGDVE
jgi:hypothetical protein